MGEMTDDQLDMDARVEASYVTPLDLARLSELTAKTWPGRWFAEHSSSNEPFMAWVHNDSGTVIGDIHTFEDAAFIAAFDPTTAKALLSEIAALRTRLRETGSLLGYLWTATGRNTAIPVSDMFSPDDPIVADVERLSTAALAATEPAEREAAR